MSGQDMRKIMENVSLPILTVKSGYQDVIATTPITIDKPTELAEALWPAFSSWYGWHFDQYNASGAADTAGQDDAAQWAYDFPDFGVSASDPHFEELAEQVQDIIYLRAQDEIGVMKNITINYE